jgi:hypothetical protein
MLLADVIIPPDAVEYGWVTVQQRGPDDPLEVVLSNKFYSDLAARASRESGFFTSTATAYYNALIAYGFGPDNAQKFYDNFYGGSETYENAEAAKLYIDQALVGAQATAPDYANRRAAFSAGLQTQYDAVLEPYRQLEAEAKRKEQERLEQERLEQERLAAEAAAKPAPVADTSDPAAIPDGQAAYERRLAEAAAPALVEPVEDELPVIPAVEVDTDKPRTAEIDPRAVLSNLPLPEALPPLTSADILAGMPVKPEVAEAASGGQATLVDPLAEAFEDKRLQRELAQPTIDLGNGISMTQDAFDEKMRLEAEEWEKLQERIRAGEVAEMRVEAETEKPEVFGDGEIVPGEESVLRGAVIPAAEPINVDEALRNLPLPEALPPLTSADVLAGIGREGKPDMAAPALAAPGEDKPLVIPAVEADAEVPRVVVPALGEIVKDKPPAIPAKPVNVDEVLRNLPLPEALPPLTSADVLAGIGREGKPDTVDPALAAPVEDKLPVIPTIEVAEEKPRTTAIDPRAVLSKLPPMPDRLPPLTSADILATIKREEKPVVAAKPDDMATPEADKAEDMGGAATPQDKMALAVKTLVEMEGGRVSETRMQQAVLREAGLFVNLLAPKGRKFSGAVLNEEIGKLSSSQLVAIAELGSGRAAALHLMAYAAGSGPDGQRFKDMSVADVMTGLYTKDARGMFDPQGESLRLGLDKVSMRTGHGNRWLSGMIAKTDSVVAPRMEKHGMDISTAKTAAEIFSAFDARVNGTANAPQINEDTGLPMVTAQDRRQAFASAEITA